MVKLTYEQTIEFIKRGVLEVNNTLVDIENSSKQYLIYKIKIDVDNKQIYFDLYDASLPFDGHKPFLISYDKIKKIGYMPIDKILNAYDMGTENRIEEIDIETDVANDVIGKTSAVIDGIELQEGQRYIFLNDKTPQYKNRIYTVRIENGVIKLVANRGRPKKIRE